MEKKTSVLIVHNYYQLPGGEDSVVANEKRLLEEQGHKVVLYTRDNKELRGKDLLTKLLLPFSAVFNFRTYREVGKLIKEEKIDIVHVHNTLTLVSPSVYYAALRHHTPVVQTMHNFRLLCPGATFYRDGHICEECVTKGLGCAVKHKCYRQSRLQTFLCVLNTWIHQMTGVYGKIHYICLTEFNREKLLRINEGKKGKEKKVVSPEKIFVKPNFTFGTGDRDSGKTGVRLGEGYYLFVGRVERIKGIDLLLDAFRKLQDRALVIAGAGMELEHYRKIAPRNVEFKGHLQGKELGELFFGAKAVIVASQWYETFGMVIAEAYAAGKPVIAGNIGNMGWMVQERDAGGTGIKFRHDSSESLIDAIQRFEKADNDWAGSTYQRYVDNFSPEKNYRQLMSVYDSVMGQR